MKNDSLNKQIISFIVENYEDEVLLADGFETAFIGIGYRGDTPCSVYDTDKCIKALMNQGMNWDEATEYFEFNVEGSFVGEQTPIFIDSFHAK
jgi:hypothetical protein